MPRLSYRIYKLVGEPRGKNENVLFICILFLIYSVSYSYFV